MAPKRNPSFFKVLIGNFTHRLRWPQNFVRKYGDVLLWNMYMTLTTESGGSWKVKLEKDEGHRYFTKGWTKFVEDLHLEMWTFLVFRLVGNSTAKVSIYGLDGCEMDIENDDSSSESESEELPLPQTAYNAKGKQLVTVEEEDWTASGEDELETTAEKEDWTTSGEDTPETSGEKMNPTFQVTLKNWHLYRMILYKSFVDESGLLHERHAVLEGRQRRHWPVTLVRRSRTTNRLEMTAGWSEFRQANKLAIGDTCSFEFVPSKNKSIIRVKVIKPAN